MKAILLVVIVAIIGGPYRNEGHAREELTGLFFVTGLPDEQTLTDGRAVEFDGSPTGLYKYRTVLGITRTLTRVAAETGVGGN